MPSTRRAFLAAGAACAGLAGCTSLQERLADLRRDPPERRVPADWHPAPGDWPGRGYGFAGNRHSPFASPPRSGPAVAWERTLPGDRRAVVVADGTVYVRTDGTLIAFDAADGAERWRREYPNGGDLAWIAGRLYDRRHDELAALSPAGEELWTHRVRLLRDLVERDGRVYLLADDELVGLHADTGAELDALDLGGGGMVTAGGPLYVVGQGLTAVNVADGIERRWHREPTATCRTGIGGLIVADGLLARPCWTRDDDGNLLVVHDAGDGERLATERFEREFVPPVLVGKTAYVGTYTASDPGPAGTLAAVDVVAGERRWRRDPGGSVGAPVVADGTVYAPPLFRPGEDLLAVDAADGRVLWRRPVRGRDPALAPAGETLYVGDGDSLLALRE